MIIAYVSAKAAEPGWLCMCASARTVLLTTESMEQLRKTEEAKRKENGRDIMVLCVSSFAILISRGWNGKEMGRCRW